MTLSFQAIQSPSESVCSSIMTKSLKIIHCFRSPVGGIFRHVRDLLGEQAKAGHQVGIICDSSTGGAYEDKLFEDIAPLLSLGLHRIPMVRSIAPRDIMALLKTTSLIKDLNPDVVHSHSAKGGVYGRMGAYLANKSIKTFYCPHGGAMHYDAGSAKGKIFFAAERFLERTTSSLVFVSDYERNAYHEKVGTPRCPEAIVYNGISPEEFMPVQLEANAADFLYIGMKRDLKGPDIFLDALKIARDKSGKELTAWFVGDGPDEAKYDEQIRQLSLQDCVQTRNAMPAREAFALADIVVVPSRAESLPYLVLEALAAQKPMVAVDVGGIPEIFDTRKDRLVPTENPEAMAEAMLKLHENKERHTEAALMAEDLKRKFSLKTMSGDVESLYLQD